MKPRIAIAVGDPAGIGPEISIKAALDAAVRAMCEPVLVGDRGALELHARSCGLSLAHVTVLERRQLEPGELKLGRIDAAHGRAIVDSAEAAIRGALAGEYEAVVAAPHTEASIRAAGIAFDGYPSFVARLAGSRRRTRCSCVLRARRSRDPHRACHAARERRGIAGAGDEERTPRDPAIEQARPRALTLGTPVLFSSVAHGSALDIAGKGKANPAAMVEAITRLVGQRRRALAT